jgi:hypothetical protein
LTSSVIVNFHVEHPAGQDWDRPLVFYDTQKRVGQPLSSYAWVTSGIAYRYDTLDVQRGVYSVQLRDLSPNTTYYFRFGYGIDASKFGPEKSFITAPREGPFTFVAGGDMGTGEMPQLVSMQASRQSPVFALIGGDLAYANGMTTCYGTWDKWLHQWESIMLTPAGHMIPFLLALGNHEAGGYGMGLSSVPFYMRWFPQQDLPPSPPDTESFACQVAQRCNATQPLRGQRPSHALLVAADGTSTSGAPEMTTYHAHRIGNSSVVLVLDSGMSIAADDPDQLNWMINQFNIHASTPLVMALYHVPIYPSKNMNTSQHSADTRKPWLPIFDAERLTIAFENHDHCYKRSKPLRGGEVNENGTLYLGDGAWGMPASGKLQGSLPWYLQRVEFKNFILRVDVYPGQSGMKFTAIDHNGDPFDTFSRRFIPRW